ncbi:MAG: ATP-dependent DNA helicase RecQ [Treponema sp.]|nr:ATP-dependent DNA helicase RecQ [Treponema sp.]
MDLSLDDSPEYADCDAEDICGEPGDSVTLAAKKAFGISYLFPWQRIVIANILDAAAAEKDLRAREAPDAQVDARHGNDTGAEMREPSVEEGVPLHQIVLLPTGAGKSLCFLVPALMLDGPTLVLYPLLALMSDQKRRMDEGGLRSVVFRGGQSEEEREENFRSIRDGARIILANPEVLQSGALLERLCGCGIRHIAVDEAHCVSEWGDSFRPAYLALGSVIRSLGAPVVTAFTATASPGVLSRVSEVLFGGSAHIVRGESDRPNIHYNVVNAWAKKRAVFKLAVRCRKPLIVFCGTRDKAEDMARELSAYCGSGKVRFYHAGLERSEKSSVESWFHSNGDAILCATCAYGMGVDKKDIRTVLHYEPSPTVESYVQEAGRGGRDGDTARAILVWSWEDTVRSFRHPAGSRERQMGDFARSVSCRRQVLLDALGGESAYCGGCDVCGRGGPAPFAEDAAMALDFLRRNRRRLTRRELSEGLLDLFNSEDCEEFGEGIWEHGDIEEILCQLEGAGLIHTCVWPWKSLMDTGGQGRIMRKIFMLQQDLARFPGSLPARARERILRLASTWALS